MASSPRKIAKARRHLPEVPAASPRTKAVSFNKEVVETSIGGTQTVSRTKEDPLLPLLKANEACGNDNAHSHKTSKHIATLSQVVEEAQRIANKENVKIDTTERGGYQAAEMAEKKKTASETSGKGKLSCEAGKSEKPKHLKENVSKLDKAKNSEAEQKIDKIKTSVDADFKSENSTLRGAGNAEKAKTQVTNTKITLK